MAFRDDREAAIARAASLDREVARLRAELEASRERQRRLEGELERRRAQDGFDAAEAEEATQMALKEAQAALDDAENRLAMARSNQTALEEELDPMRDVAPAPSPVDVAAARRQLIGMTVGVAVCLFVGYTIWWYHQEPDEHLRVPSERRPAPSSGVERCTLASIPPGAVLYRVDDLSEEPLGLLLRSDAAAERRVGVTPVSLTINEWRELWRSAGHFELRLEGYGRMRVEAPIGDGECVDRKVQMGF